MERLEVSGFWEKLEDMETMLGFNISKEEFLHWVTGKSDESVEDSSNEPDAKNIRNDSIVEEPVVEEPVVDETVVDEPVVEEPVVDETVVDETVVDEPVVDEPVVEPAINEPVVNEPITDKPIIEPVTETSVNKPATDEPAINEPVASEHINKTTTTQLMENTAQSLSLQQIHTLKQMIDADISFQSPDAVIPLILMQYLDSVFSSFMESVKSFVCPHVGLSVMFLCIGFMVIVNRFVLLRYIIL